MLPPEIAEGLRLIGEKLDEAAIDRNVQGPAVEQAAKAAATVRTSIKADDMRTTVTMLVCEQLTFDDDWWSAFAHPEHDKFLETAYFIRKNLCVLEEGLATEGQ
jgi:hypothetical protein